MLFQHPDSGIRMAIVLKLSLHWSMYYWLSKSFAMLFSLCHISQFLPPSVYVYASVTCQNRYLLDMSCPIVTHLSTPFSTPAGTRQRKPVCRTGNLYAYSTLLSTIFTPYIHLSYSTTLLYTHHLHFHVKKAYRKLLLFGTTIWLCCHFEYSYSTQHG